MTARDNTWSGATSDAARQRLIVAVRRVPTPLPRFCVQANVAERALNSRSDGYRTWNLAPLLPLAC